MPKDELFIVSTAMAVNAAMDNAANERITYWLGKLNKEQLDRFVHIVKKLMVLAEAELRAKQTKAGQE